MTYGSDLLINEHPAIFIVYSKGIKVESLFISDLNLFKTIVSVLGGSTIKNLLLELDSRHLGHLYVDRCS